MMISRMAFRVLILAGALSLTACGDDDDEEPSTEADAGATDSGSTTDIGSTTDTGGGGDDAGGGGPMEATLSSVYTNVFEASCGGAACHLGDTAVVPILDNDDGLYDRLLAEAPINDMPYITPNDVDNSYLWHKCNGTQAEVGGSGSRMPIGPQLSGDQLDLLEAWINAGAPNE